jgi:SOS-response transcriptional repressor LexA
MLSTQSAVKQQATKGEHLLVQAALPGMPSENIGILLLDSNSDRLYSRFRRDCEAWAGNEVDWFECLGEEIFERSQELGGQKCLEWMESTLSHSVRVSERVSVRVYNYHQTVQQLYAEYIRPQVLPFCTHLPQLTLEAAAGRFGKQMQVEPEGWVEVWPKMILTKDMFVTHVRGDSMEPEIPDGSLCVIASNLVGSPDGKVVLVEDYGGTGGNRYTIKRYRVSMNADPHTEGDAAWLHERFTLESLNPAYKSWDVASAGSVRVIGEFLFVV